jgi:hypothetical protein
MVSSKGLEEFNDHAQTQKVSGVHSCSMDEAEFARLLEDFVAKYQSDAWEFKKTTRGIYALNARRPLTVLFDDSPVFANYYVNFDEVFEVPVLSATFFTATGHQLTFDELNSVLPEKFDRASLSEREHEITGTSVFFIHPCQTEAVVRPFVDQGANYLHVWFVRYGPFLLYHLPY